MTLPLTDTTQTNQIMGVTRREVDNILKLYYLDPETQLPKAHNTVVIGCTKPYLSCTDCLIHDTCQEGLIAGVLKGETTKEQVLAMFKLPATDCTLTFNEQLILQEQ